MRWLVLLLALAACRKAKTPPAAPNLNVLFLNIELLRADFVGLLNPVSDAAPNIDRFFADALIFEDVSAPAGETAGSSSAVLSGLEGLCFPIDMQEARELGYVAALKKQKLQYADRVKSIAETLSESGLFTVQINQGSRSGRNIGFDAGSRRYVELDPMGLMNEPVEALERELRALPEEPFFALIHVNALHAAPYRYPLDRARIDEDSIEYVRESGHFHVHLADEGLESEEKRALARAVYRQQLRYVDEELSRVFELLEEDHVHDTIIVLYANHGDGLHDNGVSNHGVSYQSCVHVPLLVRHPRIARAKRIETPASLIDLVPTIYHWLELDADHDLHGVSLVPLLEGGEYEREVLLGRGLIDTYVRQGDWKLVRGRRDELYDLAADPHEEKNLVAEHPDVADRLRVILTAKEREAADFKVRCRETEPAGD